MRIEGTEGSGAWPLPSFISILCGPSGLKDLKVLAPDHSIQCLQFPQFLNYGNPTDSRLQINQPPRLNKLKEYAPMCGRIYTYLYYMSRCVCLFVYVCVCDCVYLWIYMCVPGLMCILIHLYVCTCLCICVYAPISICVHVYMRERVCVYVCTCVCACMWTCSCRCTCV